ncbi:MAG: glycosyltransferase family 4 protein [Methanosarcinaceae archaeon]
MVALRILIGAPYFLQYKGGQERYIYNLVKNIKRNNQNSCDFSIHTSTYPSKYNDTERLFLNKRYFKPLARPFRNPIMPSMLFANKEDADVLHLHNEHAFPSMVYPFKYNRIKKVITVHGQLKGSSSVFNAFERSYSHTIGKTIFNSMDKIVVLSRSDRSYVRSISDITKNKISIIPNGIDDRYLQGFITKRPRYYGTKLGDKDKVVLFVGPVIARKGPMDLINAFKNLDRDRLKNARLIITGNGDQLGHCRSFVKREGIKNIVFTGMIPEDGLYSMYKRADLFVLPSYSEGLPTTILEALYFKTPVVATNIPGVNDHFGKYFDLFKPGDVRSLTRLIRKNLDEPRDSEAFRQKRLAKYYWKNIAEEYVKLYHDL